MKKLLSLTLILLLLLQLWSGLGLTAAAASDTPTASSIDVESMILGDYAKTAVPADAVAIDSASAFATMGVNGTYYLTADISVVSTYTATFKGKLYGNGHTVTVSGRPLFGELNGATICDLKIVGSISASEEYLGALAKKAYGATIVGITNEATVHNAQKGKFAGGIVGYAENTTLKYCVNKGAITGHASETRLGGLVGQMDNAEATLTLENCINYGTVTGVNQTGGLVSRVENGATVTFKRCANFGAMTVTASDGGGIIGKITSVDTAVTFESCYNSAAITGATYTGGLVGPLTGSEITLTDCHNGCFVKGCACGGMQHGKLTNYTGGHVLGGLIGNFWTATAKVAFTDCSNSGDLVSGGSGTHPDPDKASGGSRTGGIAGVMECAQVTVKNCHNSGDISSDYYIGGLFARLGAAGADTLQATVSLQDCSNSGKLDTASYGGGIIGYQQYGSQLTFTRCQNSGSITTKWNAAGILCRTDSGRTACLQMTFDDCHNTGDIVAQGTAGGIAGIFTGTYDLIHSLSFTNCTNKGDVTGPNYVGGISGITDVKNFEAIDCSNEGDINVVNQGETANVGGITGRTYGAATFRNCINTGNIIETKTYKDKVYDLYVGGIAGWAGRIGPDYKSDVAVFDNCINASTVVAKEALTDQQGIVSAGIVGVSRSTCYAKRCLVMGEVNGTRQVSGIASCSSQNQQSGSEFNTCVVAAELYNNGAMVTDRTHGTAGIACYVWGDAHVYDCVVMGDITLNVSGSDLEFYQRRPCSALVGYTNNGGGEFLNNFFGGKLIAGEGTDCIVVMLAYTVQHDVSGDEGYDIDGNYSYYEYPLHYCGNKDDKGQLVGGYYSESKTPRLTEEQIAEGISFADLLTEGNPNMAVVRTCVGIEVPMLNFMRMDYESYLDLIGGHGYVENCDPTCIKCGKEKVELVHLYDHDCDTKCNYCHAEREVADHDYGPWTTIKAATETETGLRKATCRTCGLEETFEIPKLSVTPPATGESDDQNAPADGTADGAEEGSMTVIIIAAAAGGAVIVLVIVVIAVVKASKKKAKNKKSDA